MLKAMASWLENPNNEAFMLAEYDEKCLDVVASSCLNAAKELRKAASQVDDIEPEQESLLTPGALDELAEISAAFDASGDDGLMKQASVIDELLMTIAAAPGAFTTRQSYLDAEIDEARQKFLDRDRKPTRDEKKIADAEKAIENSGAFKNYRVLEAPLQSRSCPDHAGSPMARIAEATYQCSLDKKIYNFEAGYTLETGAVVPGSSVSNQNILEYRPEFSMFDSRQERLQSKIK